jgi:hypothetical protein
MSGSKYTIIELLSLDFIKACSKKMFIFNWTNDLHNVNKINQPYVVKFMIGSRIHDDVCKGLLQLGQCTSKGWSLVC